MSSWGAAFRAACHACVLVLVTACASEPWREPIVDTAVEEVPEVAPSARWRQIGRSVEGRAIEAQTIGFGSLRVYLIGGIHGNEREGLAVLEDVLAFGIDPTSARVRVVRDMNPDGTVARTRSNSHGVDLNRNWAATNFRARRGHGGEPFSEPETLAVARDIERFDPDLVVVFHSSTRGRPFVNFDGPARALAEAFADAAQRSDGRWSVLADMGYATPGSLGSYIGIDRGIPILTIEFRRGAEPTEYRRAAIDGVRAVCDAAR